MSDLDDPQIIDPRDKERRAGELRDLEKVMTSEEGERVLRRLIARCGIYRLSFDVDSQRLTDFREGERNVGNWFLKECLAANPARAELLVRAGKLPAPSA